MGGFSGGGNPLMQMGAMVIDAYTGVPVASTALSMAEAKGAQSSQAASLQGNYARQAELLRRQQARELEERQDLLRRATATQRARMGALGVGGSASSEALIGGLQQQATQQMAEVSADFEDRKSMLDWNLARQQEGIQAAGRNQMLGSVQSLFGGQGKSRRSPTGGFNLL